MPSIFNYFASNASAAVTTRSAVLAIGGSDSAGLAGLQADNRALGAMGCHGLNIVSAVTAQNNECVVAVEPVDTDVFAKQWQAVQAFRAKTIKCGLLCSSEQIEFILKNKKTEQKLVWDPVTIASSQVSLIGSENNEECLRRAQLRLLAACDLVTPNRAEAIALAKMLGREEAFSYSNRQLVNALVGAGAKAVLVTGGIGNGDMNDVDADVCEDVLGFEAGFNQGGGITSFSLVSPVQTTCNTRGTGCQLASIISACLARGIFLEDAVVVAKSIINRGLSQSFSVDGVQKGSLVLSDCISKKDLPAIFLAERSDQPALTFPSCDLPNGEAAPIGLYPVVDSSKWVARLLALGVSTIQLRIKTGDPDFIAEEIIESIRLVKKYNARLFINDYWQLAIKHGAYGVHLGQEDLIDVDLTAIASAGLRLGVSTHCHYEVCRVLAFNPSYIACGPVFPTDSKPMPWETQGIRRLRYWKEMLGDSIPLVAIGGINLANISDVAASICCDSTDGIALISAITRADSPDIVTKKMLSIMSNPTAERLETAYENIR